MLVLGEMVLKQRQQIVVGVFDCQLKAQCLQQNLLCVHDGVLPAAIFLMNIEQYWIEANRSVTNVVAGVAPS